MPLLRLRMRCLQLAGNGARPLVGLGRWQGNRKANCRHRLARGHRDAAAVGCHDLSDESERPSPLPCTWRATASAPR